MPNWCDNSVRLGHPDKSKIDELVKVIDEADVGIFYRDEDNAIHITMETAWAPPTALYEYLVEQGWDVDAKYLEPGMGFGGTFNNEFGDNYYEYDISDLDSIEALPEDVIDFGDLRAQYEDYKQSNGGIY
jgi:hypothetical protein